MELAISLKGVSKTFGTIAAVCDLDLALAAGAVYGFIGPNGAGKTTSLRLIMAILFPDGGEISVLGRSTALEARDRIGYLPEERGVYRKMKVGAFLTYMARLKAVNEAAIASRVRWWLERVELAGVIDKRCEDLSKGMLQKVQLIAAVLHEPELLILDEPFSGLDPVNARLLRDVVLEIHERGSTILFSTHVMVQAEELCDHIVMLDQGRKVLDESLASIRSRHTTRAIRLEPLDAGADVTSLQALPEVSSISRDGRAYRIDLRDSVDSLHAMRTLAGAIAVSKIEMHRPTLEDIFVGLATRKVVKDRAPA
jgi:ABC-2 type transport system ATP-binding protein